MEGTSGCESCIVFTGGVVEAVLAAVTELVDARALLAREGGGDRGVRGLSAWSMRGAKCLAAKRQPRRPCSPPKRFGRRETPVSSGL